MARGKNGSRRTSETDQNGGMLQTGLNCGDEAAVSAAAKAGPGGPQAIIDPGGPQAIASPRHSLATNFTQNWSNAGLIAADDNWANIPAIVGYRGDNLSSTQGVDLRTITAHDAAPVVDVNANQTNPVTFVTGGVTEFDLADDTIALAGSATADIPYIVIYLDSTGQQNIRFQCNLRDLDSSADDAAQQINIQYRTSPTGAWTNAPGGYFADVTQANLASLVTAVNLILPADANNSGTLEIRIMSVNAVGNDEWVGIDDIQVSAVGALAIDDVSHAEGSGSDTVYTFTVTRAGGSAGAVTADWAVSFPGGAGVADAVDFTGPTSGTVSFADGETSKTITVTVTGDTVFESGETFTINLTNATGGATFTDSAGLGTITNDDPANPVVTNLQGDVSHYHAFDGQVQLDAGGNLLLTDADSANFEGGQLSVSITQGAATGDALSVMEFPGVTQIASNNVFVDGVIIATFSGGTNGNPLVFNFLDQATPARVQTLMRALAFSNNEADPSTATREITYSFAGPMGVSSYTSAVDFPGTLYIGFASADEGDTGTTIFTFTVSREDGSAGAVSATWTLNAPGGATFADSADFAGFPQSGTVSFIDGQLTAEIQILVQGDTDVEDPEDFTVALSDPTGGAALGFGLGFGTIQNDDAADTPPVVDLDGPGGTNDFATAYTENDVVGVQIGDVDLTVSDDAFGGGGNISRITLTIASGVSGDVLFADGSLPPFFVANWDAGSFTLTLTAFGGSGVPASFYTDALTHIRYRHDGDDPTVNGARTTRSISVVANDEVQDGPAAISTITINALYDAPTIDLDANNNIAPGTGFANTYVEGNFGVRFVDFDPLVTAEGGETVSLTFTITLTDAVAGDELFLASGGFQGQDILMTPYNPGTGILTIYGSGTRAEWQQALGEFAFRHVGNNPTVDGTDAQRTITVTVSDGGGTGNTATTVMTITPVNQPAVIGGTIAGTVTEDGTETAGGALTIADPDNVDTFVAQTNATTTYGTFSIDPAGNWSYDLDSDDPDLDGLGDGETAQDVIQVLAADGTSQNITITVNGADEPNAPPVVDLNGPDDLGDGFAATYTENDPGVPIGDVDLTISDDNAIITSVTVVITDGRAGDVLNVDSLPLGLAQLYDSNTFTLTISGVENVSSFVTALRQVRFHHEGEDPDLAGTATSRTLSVTASDGSNNSVPVTSVITIVAVNDPPTLTATPQDRTFTEDVSGPAPLFSDPVVSTVEPDQAITAFTITVDGVLDGAAEILTVGNHDIALVNTGPTPMLGGTIIYSVSVSGGGTATVTFGGASLTAAALEILLNGMTYNHLSQDPTAGDRLVTITYLQDSGGSTPPDDNDSVLTLSTTVTVVAVNDDAVFGGTLSGAVTEDGILTAGGQVTVDDVDGADTIVAQSGVATAYGTFSIDAAGNWTYELDNDDPDVQDLDTLETLTDSITIQSADGTQRNITITINGKDEPPVVDLDSGTNGIDYVTSYTENGTGAFIGNGLTITSHNGIINGAVIELTDATIGDLLQITGGLPPGVTITSQTDTQIQLQGAASAAAYAAYIGSIRYLNTTDDPTEILEDRTVEVWVFDDQAVSQHAFAAIDVIGVNDVAVLGGDTTGSATENDPTNAEGTVTAFDLDTNESRVQADSLTGVYGSFQIAENGFWLYAPNDNNNLRGGQQVTDTFTVTAYDGSATIDVVITITGLNDAPSTFAFNLSGGLTEDSGSYVASGSAVAFDVDDDETGWQTGTFVTTYGTFVITNVPGQQLGEWTYTLSNAGAAVQGLGDGEMVVDSMQMLTIDGSAGFTLQIAINGRSDAPEGIDNSIEALFDGVYTFTVADFPFTDAENDGLLEVIIAGTPTLGTLRLGAVAVTGGQAISAADIAAGLLTYEPAGGAAAGDGYTSFTFVVRDDGSTANGGANEDGSSNVITIDLIDNLPPAVNFSDNVTFVEDNPGNPGLSPIPLDANGDALVTDSDSANFDTGTLTLSISSGGIPAEDILFVRTTASVSVSGSDIVVNSMVIGTWTGGTNGNPFVVTFNANATPAAVSELMRALVYDNSSQEPTQTARFYSLVITDGDGGTSNTGTGRIDVFATNDAPAGTDKPVTVTEDTPYSFTAADFGFGDTDGDTLLSVIITTLPGAGTLTLDGVDVTPGQEIAAGDIPLLVFTPALNASGTGYATFTFQVRDNGGTENGSGAPFTGEDTDQSANTITFNVNAVNDAPVFTGLGATATYIENGPAVVIDADATLTDIELAAAGNYNGSVLWVQRSSGADASDLFSFTGVNVTYVGTDLSGTVTSNASGSLQTIATASRVGGAIFVMFNANATQADVNAVMQQLTYASSSDNPPATVQLAYVFNDGNSGAQGSGGAGFSFGSATVSITAVNDRPTINGLANNTAQFTEGGAAVALDAPPTAATVTDADSPDFAGGSLTVAITTGNVPAEDLLGLNGSGTVALSDGVNVGSEISIGGIVFGTVTASSSSAISIAFDEDATPARVQELLRIFNYTNTNTLNPSAAQRTVTWTLVDGDGIANSGADTRVVSSFIAVTQVNDAPSGTSATITIDEDTPRTLTRDDFGFSDPEMHPFIAVLVDPPTAGTLLLDGIAITDPDTFVLTSAIDNGDLVFVPAPDANGDNHASFTFQVVDGASTANGGEDTDPSEETLTFDVTPVNDAPVNTAPATATVDEDASVTLSTLNGNAISVADVDATTLTVTLSATNGTLTIASTLGLTFSGGSDGTNDASMTFSGTAAAINAALGAGLTYNPTGDYNGPAAITISTTDNGETGSGPVGTDTDTVTITVNPVNDAPTSQNLDGDIVVWTENGPNVGLDAGGNATVADVDSANFGGGSLTVTITDIVAAQDQLSVANIGGIMVDQGAGTVSFGGTEFATYTGGYATGTAMVFTFNPDATPAAVQALIRSLQYNNSNTDDPAAGTRNLSWVLVDGDGGTDTLTMSSQVTVTALNDAPVLDAARSPAMIAVNEDAAAPVGGTLGTAVSSLVDFVPPTGQVDNVNDPDSGALLGIAITGVTPGGTLYYSTDGGASWAAVPAVSESAALLLGPSARLYFQPAADYNGTITSLFTFRAWDQTSGAPGGFGDTTVNGGTTAFSTATDTVSQAVTAINDAPVVVGGGAVSATTINEDNPSGGQTIDALFGGQYSDAADAQFSGGNPGGSSPGQFSGIAVVANGSSPATGVWQYFNGTSWVAIGAASPGAAVLLGAPSVTLIRFQPAPDFNGPAPTLTVHLIDNSLGFGIVNGQIVDLSAMGATGGTTAYSTGTVVLSQDVIAVNDAPVNTVPGTQTINEDASVTLSTANFNAISVADVDATTLTVTLSVAHGTLTIASTLGLTFSGGSDGSADASMTFSGTAAAINAALGAGLTYNPNADFNGSDAISVVTTDGGQTGTGPVGTDSDPVTVNINAINDAPVVIGGAAVSATTINEDMPGAGQTIQALFSGQYTDAADNQIPNGGASSPGQFSGIAVTANGSSAATGQWQYFSGGVWTDIGPASEGAAVLLGDPFVTQLRFNPAPDFNGPAPTLTVHLIDNSLVPAFDNGDIADLSGPGATGGTTAFSADTVVLSQNVTAVNDAPVVTIGTPAGPPVTVSNFDIVSSQISSWGDGPRGYYGQIFEAEGAVLSSLAFQLDGDNGTTDYTVIVATATFDGDGRFHPGTVLFESSLLTMTGDPDQVYTTVEIDTGSLALTPGQQYVFLLNANAGAVAPQNSGGGHVPSVFNGSLYPGGSFVYLHQNNGSTAADFASNFWFNDTNFNYYGDMAFRLTFGGAAPGLAATEQVALDLKGQIAVGDVDAGGADLTVTLSVDYGILTVTPGASGATVGGSGTGTVTITGTLAEIEALLDTDATSVVAFTANTDDPPASATLTVTANDGGATGADPGLTGTPTSEEGSASAVITIIAVNDEPTSANVTINGPNEDDPYTFLVSDFPFSDADASPLSVVITGLPANGDILLNGVPILAGAEILYADIADGDLTFMPDPDGFGPAYTTFTFRVRDDGGTLNGGDDLSAEYTATVNVTPDNLPPVVDLNGAGAGIDYTTTFIEDGVAVAIGSGLIVSDPDSGLGDLIESAVITLTDRVAGDSLTILGSLPAGISAVTTNPAGQIVITLTGPASQADYQTALGQIRYATTNQDPTFGGTDLTRSVTVTVNDGLVDSAVATTTINITAVDDLPVAQPDAFTINENGSIVAGNLFASNGSGADTDPDGPPLTISAVNGAAGNVNNTILLASGASLTVNSNGTFSYDPGNVFLPTPTSGSGASNTPGQDSFSYTLAGGNTVTVTITLTGLDTDDVLLGTAGSDILMGGNGNDIYFVENASDLVLEAAGQGFDTVYTGLSYALAAGSEVEILSVNDHNATTAIDLTGNEFANYVYGNAGVNVLDGGAGADVMLGFGGNDVFHVDSAADYVFEAVGQGFDTIYTNVSYALAGESELEVLSVNDHNATSAIDLSGNGFANYLYGNAGVNRLVGGAGADVMLGFGGDDFFYVDQAGDYVFEAVGQGFDTIYTNVSYALAPESEVEILSVDDHNATSAIDLTGNGFANSLYGNAGNNVLDGKGGADVMLGFGGNDIYYVDDAADYIGESAGGGADMVLTSVSWALAAGQEVELLAATGTGPVNLTGNEIANALYGNDGDNVLDGRGGNDLLVGLLGADTFAFTTATGAGNVDVVLGFETGIDRIALDDAIFGALGSPGGLNPNAFTIGNAATDGNDRIIYDSLTGQLFYDADGSGAGAQVLFALMAPGVTLTASDFVII